VRAALELPAIQRKGRGRAERAAPGRAGEPDVTVPGVAVAERDDVRAVRQPDRGQVAARTDPFPFRAGEDQAFGLEPFGARRPRGEEGLLGAAAAVDPGRYIGSRLNCTQAGMSKPAEDVLRGDLS
jgi:hypothetical protein